LNLAGVTGDNAAGMNPATRRSPLRAAALREKSGARDGDAALAVAVVAQAPVHASGQVKAASKSESDLKLTVCSKDFLLALST